MYVEVFDIGDAEMVSVLTDYQLEEKDWPRIEAVLGDPLTATGPCVDFREDPLVALTDTGQVSIYQDYRGYCFEYVWLFEKEEEA